MVLSNAGAQWNADTLLRTRVCRYGALGQGEPQICWSDSGTTLVFWQDIRNTSSIWGQRLDSDGFLLWDSVGVNAVSSLDQYPADDLQALSDGNGGAYLFYRQNSNVRAQRMDKNGNKLWGVNGILVRGDVPFTIFGDLSGVLAGDGSLILTWRKYQTGNAIEAQKLDPSGAFLWGTQGILVSPSSETPGTLHTKIVDDGGAGAFVLWGRQTDSTHVQHLDASGMLSYTWPVSLDINTSAHYIDLSIDGAGGVYVTGRRPNQGVPELRLWRINAQGEHLYSNQGMNMTDVPVSPAEIETLPDGEGGVIVCWIDVSSDSKVKTMRVNDQGAQVWGSAPIVLCTDGSYKLNLALATDSANGAYAAWTDDRYGSFTFFGQHVSGIGSVQWESQGHAICTAPMLGSNFEETAFTMVGKLGTPIIAWTDSRTSEDLYRVYATDLIEIGSTSLVEDRTNGRDLLVYPNPTAGTVYLDLHGNDHKTVVDVLDMSGRIVHHSVVSSTGIASITLEAGAGTYVFRVAQDRTIAYERVVLTE